MLLGHQFNFLKIIECYLAQNAHCWAHYNCELGTNEISGTLFSASSLFPTITLRETGALYSVE